MICLGILDKWKETTYIYVIKNSTRNEFSSSVYFSVDIVNIYLGYSHTTPSIEIINAKSFTTEGLLKQRYSHVVNQTPGS